MTDVPHTIPVGKQHELIKQNQKARSVDEASPVELRDEFVGEYTHTPAFDLAYFQAAADQFIEDAPKTAKLTEDRDVEYYQVTTHTFLFLAKKLASEFDGASIPIESFKDLIDLHTVETLESVFGYKWDPHDEWVTICRAYNDQEREEWDLVQEEQFTEDPNLGFPDARGLVVQRRTHKTPS